MSKGKKDRRVKRKERTAKVSGNALFSKALRDIDNKMKPPMPFEIVRSDIVNMRVDAIVNTANPRPVIGAGVDAGIS